MSGTATKLLEEELRLARRILNPVTASGTIDPADVVRLASVTLELHRKLSAGLPFPAAWLCPLGKPGVASSKRSDS